MAFDASRHHPLLPQRWVKIGLVLALATLAALAIGPAYFTGQWPWVTPPQVPQLERLQALQDQGLSLPGWTLTSHRQITINQQDWLLSEYQRSTAPHNPGPPPWPPVSHMVLLLHPQPWHSDQPQLEWLDLASAQDLTLTSRRRVTLTASRQPPQITATASFSHGRNQQHTVAALQWYAWPRGGHPSPGAWFWNNQWSQLTDHSLTPWIAVSLLLPMEPLAEVAPYQALAVDLGSAIQQQLSSGVWSGAP
jgi:cyanoexosortase B-associated protein